MFDYLIMVFTKEFLGLHYINSLIVGSISGAIINYTINRNWSFNEKSEKIYSQLPKFVIMVIGSIFLKSIGTYTFTEFCGVDYKISRLVTDLFVGLGFNFLLQRYWVFKPNI